MDANLPFAIIGSAKIYFQVLGEEGPWAAVISGGRYAISDTFGLAQAVAARGYRVLVHDRRNCGHSSLDFQTAASEEAVWASDLNRLIKLLGIDNALVIGLSRGGRVAKQLALDHPERTRAVGIWGLTGGAATIRQLDQHYFGRYLRACVRDGMAGVCAEDHFADLIKIRPERRETLMAFPPEVFMTTIRRWQDDFRHGAGLPVMGFSDETLNRITAPTAIALYYDKSHPLDVARHCHAQIAGSEVFDFDPGRPLAAMIPPQLRKTDSIRVAQIFCDFDRARCGAAGA